MSQAHFIWLSQINPDQTAILGTKAANLGQLTKLGMPIPNGYVISSLVFHQFLDETHLGQKLPQVLQKSKLSSPKKLQDAAIVAQQLILHADLPDHIEQQIIHNYQQLSTKDVHVAVRQSAIPDGPDTINISGDSYLNVIGDKQLVAAIKKCWASLFEAKAVYYRQQQHLDQIPSGCGIIVQRMVDAEVAGISFSLEPLTMDPSQVTIEAIWGLGEPIANGQLTPDHYQVAKQDWSITGKDIIRQDWQLAKTTHKITNDPNKNNIRIPVSVAWQRKQKLADRLIVDLARLTVRLEEQFGTPQQVEWAYADHTLFIVQSDQLSSSFLKAETTTPQLVNLASSTAANPNATPLLVGIPVAPGVAVGQIKVLKKSDDINKLKPNTIVVLDEADLDFTPSWQPPIAIISNEGGRTANAAIVARELGIPAVLGVNQGTKLLKSGEVVTIDGTSGTIYQGDLSIKPATVTITSANAHITNSNQAHHASDNTFADKTATKVMVNISEPTQAEDIAAKNVDGVGLLRAEYLFQTIGQHPQYFIDKGKEEVFVEALYSGIMEVAKSFDHRPVIYRLGDLTANQLANLDHGDKYEVHEDNPALGYRGAYRHANDGQQLMLELQAIKKVRQYHKNVWLMVPFIRTPDELIEIKHHMSQLGLHRGGSFKLFMMAEVPSNVILLDQFIGVGIDGISIGSNDLTQLILGLDRHNPKVAAQFDERNEAVMWSLQKIIKGAAEHGIMSSICGQAPSVYPELTRKLVEWGITSISVSPEAIQATRRLVADAEFELVRQGKTIKMKG